MRRLKLIGLFSLILLGFASVYARDMRLYVSDITGTRLKCKSVYATDKDNYFIQDADFCPSDTSFLFKSFPEIPFIFKITIDNDTEDFWINADYEAPVDTAIVSLPVDYTSVQLKEVTVKADSRLITDTHTLYRPNNRQKKSSHDGVGLLLAMNIPELKINPVNKSVETISGEGVSYFIDYVPASAQQVQNLRPADVKNVEIYQTPADPVFLGKRNVVNYVLVKYEYGGYGKVSASQTFVTPITNYSLSVRNTFRNFIFDAGLNGQYYKLPHLGSEAVRTFLYNGNTLKWKQVNSYTKTPSDSESAYIIMSYGSKTFNMTNTVGFGHSKSRNKLESDILYEIPDLKNDYGQQETNSNGLTPYWDGNFQFIFDRGWDLAVLPSFSYAHNTYDNFYDSSSASITNNVKENTWEACLNVQGGKTFGRGHRIGIQLIGDNQSFRINYSGTVPASIKSRETEFNFIPSVSFNFGKASLYASAGIGSLNSSINSESQTDLLLRYYVNAKYTFNKYHSLSFSSQLNYTVIPMNQRSPNLVLQNQLEGVKGNPLLKPTVFMRQYLQYLTFPAQWLSLSAFGRFDRHNRAIASVVTAEEFDGYAPLIVSGSVNSGFQNILTFGLGANVSLFSDKLTIGANASYSNMRRHGLQTMKDDYITFSAYANYYIGNFYIQPFYSHSTHSYSNANITEGPSTYQILVGWGNGNFNLTASAQNFARSSWKNTVTTLKTGDYTSVLTNFGGLSHRSFRISATYSFSYGKKLNRQNINAPTSGIESGILK